jgi:imidazolonepropionase-like amidohydrolase
MTERSGNVHDMVLRSPESVRPVHRAARVTLGLALALGVAATAFAAGTAPPVPGKTSSSPRVPLPFTIDPYPSTYRPLPRVDTMITGATVLDGTGRRFDSTSVLLRDGKVTAIGPDLAAPTGVTVIDARGRWVTPGIVDIHTHLGNFPFPFVSTDFSHSDVSETTDPVTPHVWAEHSITVQDPAFDRAIAAGVTTVQVLPGSGNLFGGRGVVLHNVPATTVQARKFPSAPASLKMACGENPKYNYGDDGRFPSSRMGNVAGYREAFLRARKYLKDWQAYEQGDEAKPPERDLRLDTLAGVLRGDIKVHAHCYRADEMAIVLDVAREFDFKVTAFHHAAEAYKIPEQLKQAGTCAAVWSDWWGFKQETFDAIRENAAFLDASGACVMLHSDSGVIGQRLVLEAAKAVASGRRAGIAIPHERAITWVTSVPATTMGIGDRIGTLEPGKNADVVIWSGDPFSVYTLADQVFIDGALVFDRADPRRQPRSDLETGLPSVRTQP